MSDPDQIPRPLRIGVPPVLVNKRIADIAVADDHLALALHVDTFEEYSPTATPRAYSPDVMVTPPGVSTFTMFAERPRQNSEAPVKRGSQRPQLLCKANTAPPGALRMHAGQKPQFKPEVPRRAVSSTTAQAFTRSGSRDRRRPSKDIASTATKQELGQFHRQATRSLISKRKTKRNSGGRMGLRGKPLVWRMSSPPKAYELPPELRESFSEKARVRQTLKGKNMDRLRVDCLDVRGPRTPAVSIVSTPTGFYKRPGSLKIKAPPSPARSLRSCRSGGRAGSVTPLGGGTPPRSSTPLRNATSPSGSISSAPSPSRSGTLSKAAKHFSLPLSPVAQQRVPWRKSIVVDSPLRNMTPVPDERRPVYIPGPITLEEDMYGLFDEHGSTANMERVDDGTVPKAKRFSDLVALDSIVMYFQALGVAEEASAACLDRFWLERRRNSHSHPSSGTGNSLGAPGVPCTPPPAQPLAPTTASGSIATTFEGIFRSQKALRDDDSKRPRSPGTPGRRKPRLRQLLRSSRKSG